MARSNWNEYPEYVDHCIEAVCDKLELKDTKEKAYIAEVAHHSISDNNFFTKIRTLYGLKKQEVKVEQVSDVTYHVGNPVEFRECGDGKEDTKLPSFSQKRLDELSKHD